MKKNRKKSQGLITVEASRLVPESHYDAVPSEYIKWMVAKDLAKFMLNNDLIKFEEKSTKVDDNKFIALHGLLKVQQLRIFNGK